MNHIKTLKIEYFKCPIPKICIIVYLRLAPHSSTLAWKIPWTEEPGRLQSMGSLGVRHNWVTSLSLFTFIHWRRTWQPIPVFLPGESQGQGSLVGCRLWGRRVVHDWSDLAAAAAGEIGSAMKLRVLSLQKENWMTSFLPFLLYSCRKSTCFFSSSPCL